MISPNIMIDIETLGLEPACVILSIGAVTDTGEEFYIEISPNSQGDRLVNLDTVKWWMSQPIKPPMEGITGLANVLFNLSEFISQFTEPVIWANGTDFDISILTDAYRQFGRAIPWAYNSVRDYRTLAKLFTQVPRTVFQGDKHNALADAKHQMEHLKEILAHIIRLERSYVATSEG